MDAKDESAAPGQSSDLGPRIFRTIGLGVVLFVLFAYFTGNRQRVESAFFCITAICMAIGWLFLYVVLVFERAKERFDILERRVVLLEKRLKQQSETTAK
jgi:hypothetical protein